ncbi:Ribosomal protein S13 [Penicillium daleae]|uniref:Ribosomal protein S13 n=1 Tax=Penicillium daleae TaxID=63821 RepID=A0AAD6FYR7_9EURO|nr:Ribosomal protein S13 [Penicillium daleae]KAJ5438760.1 Ribosomal protein S13 [Penicillium daleae]
MIEQKSLETFFGIGNHTSSRLLARFNIHPTCRVGELANKQVLDLTAVLSDMKIENDLRREVLNDIKRLKETGTYRGRRHALGLPVRGQRTRTQVGVSFVPISCLSLRPDLATSLALVHVVLVASGDFVAGRIKTPVKLNRMERRL